MPIWLRNATYRFISDSIQNENEAQNKSIKKGNSTKTTLDWVNPDRSKF